MLSNAEQEGQPPATRAPGWRSVFTPGGFIRRYGRLSPRPWRVDSVLELVLGLLTLLGLLALVALGVDWLTGGLALGTRRFNVSIGGTLLFQALALALVARFLRQNQLTWTQAFGLGHPQWGRALLVGLVAGVLVFPPNLTLMWVSQRLLEWQSLPAVPQEAVQTLRTTNVAAQKVLLGLLAILTAPVVEETLFRGLLYPALKQVGFPRLALWGTSVVFAITHANLMTFLPLTFFAVVLTLLYERTDNLLAPMVTHSLFNAGNFIWVLVANQ